jgi:hypothetical protein
MRFRNLLSHAFFPSDVPQFVVSTPTVKRRQRTISQDIMDPWIDRLKPRGTMSKKNDKNPYRVGQV